MTSYIKLLATALFLALATLTLVPATSASAATNDTYIRKFVSTAPCTQKTGTVLVLQQNLNPDGSPKGNWFLVTTLPNYANPNYPCKTPPARTSAYPVFKPVLLHRATRQVDTLKLKRWHMVKADRVLAKFNNRAKWALGACQYEDSERCFWDAASRGNGEGKSFIRLYHRTFYINL